MTETRSLLNRWRNVYLVSDISLRADCVSGEAFRRENFTRVTSEMIDSFSSHVLLVFLQRSLQQTIGFNVNYFTVY